jgi:tousled-like kinase
MSTHSRREPNRRIIRATNCTARITDFFSNSTDADRREDSRDPNEELVRRRGIIRELQEELEFSRLKILEDEKLIQHKNEEIKQLIHSYDEIQKRFAEYKNRIQKVLASKVLELEKSKQIENFHDLMIKKTNFGYLRSIPPIKSMDDWIDGALITKLKDEKLSIEAQLDTIDQEKKLSKAKRRKTNEPSQDQKDYSKNLLSYLSKRLEEIENQLQVYNAEKYDIVHRDKLISEGSNCYFVKRNPDTQISAWPMVNERYQIISLIGHGGFSEVFKAYDLEACCYVALKLHSLNPKWDADARISYLKHTNRENDVYKKLDHPNIVQFFDSFVLDGVSVATILELCEGPDLDYQLKRNGMIAERNAKNIIRQILLAIKYLNEQNPKIIHYDLKPQNILFTKEGIVKLTDFGLCKIWDNEESKIELTSQGAGTYWYLAPECFENGKNPPLISSKVDVWAIGVIFYQMLFNKKPFGHNMSQDRIMKEKIIERSPSVSFPEKPHISPEIKEFIRKCLVHSQDARMDIHAAWAHFSKMNN